MSDPRVAHCVFCDDIRHEVGNKVSLMGIYSGDMIFAVKPPAVYPKMGIVVWLICDKDDLPKSMKLSVRMPPNSTEVVKSEHQVEEIPVQYREDARKLAFKATLYLAPVVFNEEGFMEVYIETERETLRAGRLMVRFPEDAGPTALAPTENAQGQP